MRCWPKTSREGATDGAVTVPSVTAPPQLPGYRVTQPVPGCLAMPVEKETRMSHMSPFFSCPAKVRRWTP